MGLLFLIMSFLFEWGAAGRDENAKWSFRIHSFAKWTLHTHYPAG